MTTGSDGLLTRYFRRQFVWMAAACAAAILCAPCDAAIDGAPSFEWSEIGRILLWRDYNTRLVVGSTMILGAASGLIGSFLLLRKRSLMGDVLSHATLPGIAGAFMVMALLGGTGKYLPGLLLGALLTGLLGVGCVLVIRSMTRLKDDAALGIVLSVFFGLGIALIGLVQDMPQGSAAGLSSFIYGKTASMVRADLWLILTVTVLVAAASVLLYKQLTILCFDEQFAGALGWRPTLLDVLLMTLVAVITVIGLQSVGLILIIALLIIPAAAARFWTQRLKLMLVSATTIGAAGGWLGASMSAALPKLPAGAVIVVVCAAVFVISMLFGPARGAVPRLVLQWRTNRRIGQQHVLRAMYEAIEQSVGDGALDAEALTATPVAIDRLRSARSWSSARLHRLIGQAQRAGLIDRRDAALQLTTSGAAGAARVVRNHRLWEVFLITHAEIAPSHVDRDADQIEHVLGTELVQQLERKLGTRGAFDVPPSPHALNHGGAI